MHSYVTNVCMVMKSYLCLLLLVREFLSTMFDFHAILSKMQIQISVSDNYSSSSSSGGSSSGSSVRVIVVVVVMTVVVVVVVEVVVVVVE